MKTNLLPILLSVAVMLASCKKDKNLAVDSSVAIEKDINKNTVVIKYGIETGFIFLEPRPPVSAISAIIVTIADANGNVLIESKELRLFGHVVSFGPAEASPVPVKAVRASLFLPSGNYIITKFLGFDSSGLVTWAVPINGSRLSYSIPEGVLLPGMLPLQFSVEPFPLDIYNRNHNLTYMHGLTMVEDFTSEDFGYSNFGNW